MRSAEARYRALVRVLPAWYRAERGDEMVGTLLDLHEERDRAALWGELRALLALGLRTRLAARAAPARTVAFGDLVRHVSLLGLLWGVLRSACDVGYTLWMLVAFSGPYPGAFHSALVSGLSRDLVLLAVALIPLVLLVDGWRRTARIAAGAILAAGALWFLVRHSFDPGAAGYFAPQWLPLVLVLAGFHVDAPSPPSRPWWRIIGGSLVLAPVLALRFGLPGDLGWFAGLSPLVWLCALAGAGYLLVRPRTGPRPAWTLALAVGIGLAVTHYVVRKNGILPFDVVVLAQVCCAGAIVVALAVVGIRDYRRAVAN
ncbi:hypothetical protein CU254_25615 [Amycolatopsis sp. AA4]|uniref:hypothetical protein n=1 Tax=Actinomycetes TaxID=1760 RepID=UPI0001B54057|nr:MULTISPECIES: hypothetical protein [Actinomycetes]ATY13437.1 hypothetical protein CU254_25615 [Amycolatopsis sp. AA4]EFL09371.1 predicted protein [Streptomyces sp. AA4]